jgi:parallel beta-helix repeat protein
MNKAIKRRLFAIGLVCLFMQLNFAAIPSLAKASGIKTGVDLEYILIQSNSNPVHNLDSGKDFPTIQAAIDDIDTKDGNTIMVDTGYYYENIKINKSINLNGENNEDTIIYGGYIGSVITISANDVTISDFAIEDSGLNSYDGGISISNYNNAHIYNNVFRENANGIYLYQSENIKIKNNKFFREYSGWDGAWIELSSNILIENNEFSGYNLILEKSDIIKVKNNIFMNNTHASAFIQESSNVEFFENTVKNNGGYGISVFDSHKEINIYHNNFISNDAAGISALFSDGLKVYLNNFIDNNNGDAQAADNNIYYENSWCNEKLKKGNYWDDYEARYPSANKQVSKGIWDTPYDIHSNVNDPDNTDNYPLIKPWSKSKSKTLPFLQELREKLISVLMRFAERFALLTIQNLI